MTKQKINFKKLEKLPSELTKGCIYFIPKTGLIHIATGSTAYDTFGPKIVRYLTSGKKIANITIGNATYDLYCEENTDTWRPITDSVSTTSSSTSASATAVKTAYDLAASKGTGTITGVTAGNGLTGGGTSGSVTINVDYGTTSNTVCQGNDSRLSNSRPASDVYSWAKESTKPDYEWDEINNKPDFATVATSGSYTNLSDKPSIGDGTVTITQNGTSIGSFTTNQTTNSTIALTNSNFYHTRKYDSGLQISTGNGISSMYVPIASSSQLGVVKGGTTSGKIYGVQIDSNGAMTVNVPWTDTNTTYSFSASNPNLSWGTTSTIGTAGGTTYKVTMPSNPNTDTNYYLTGVTGSGNGTVTFTRQGLSNLTWDASHTHSYLPLTGGSVSGVFCASTRLRVNAPNSTTVFGYMDADIFESTSNVATVRIGSCYGGSSDINATETAVNYDAINIYRGKVGIGGTVDDTTLRALHDGDYSLGVTDNLKVGGHIFVDAGEIRYNTDSSYAQFVIYDVYNDNSITIEGSTIYAGSIYGSGFYESSDERLKNFKEEISIDFEALKKLPKKYFEWIDSPGKLEIGTSAQEVQKLYPEIVNENKDGNLAVDYAKLSVVALKAVDELYDKNKELEARIEKLEKLLIKE